MLILSWNVAGLSTTVNRIHEAYGGSTLAGTATCTGSSSKDDENQKNVAAAAAKSAPQQQAQHPSTAIASYFQRHGADIICLQEHKIPKQQLSSRSEPRHVSNTPGYESFWACCVDDKKKGLNGVVTFCRTGSVIAADPAPLGSPDLDQQGRCIMTDHGSFALFNVYVPNTGGQSMAYKMKFLKALRNAMQQKRKEKPVILAGDLNISHAKRDVYWKNRVVLVNEVLEEVRQSMENGCSDTLPRWKFDLSQNWSKILAAMETKEVVETTTTNTLTGEKYNKFRLAVTVDGKQRVFLGSHEVSPDYCLYYYSFSSVSYEDDETGEEITCREENAICIQTLAELMAKIAGIRWEDKVLREIAERDASIDRSSPSRKWLTAIIEEDGMIDGFRHFYPNAESRFTCWHQFTNKRYENDGSRIDYILFDKCLLPRVGKGDVSGPRSCGDATSEEELLSEAAAFRAATANGRFKPASFEGGGISEASQEALDTQFGPPHTGMIYTPPSFSDHIAISLSTNNELLSTDLALQENDTRTRKAQPHKLQTTIRSFFIAGAASQSSKNAGSKTRALGMQSATAPSKRLKQAAKKPPKSSILHHFQKKGSS